MEVYPNINEELYPERKEEVGRLIRERKESDEAKEVIKAIEEQVEREKYQTFGARFGAAIIDFIFFIILGYVLSAMFGMVPSWVEEGYNYVAYFDIYIYSVVLHWLYGQTLGKAVMEVKVVNYPDESPISFQQAFLRDCVPIVLLIVMVVFMFFAPVPENVESFGLFSIVLLALSFTHFIWFLLEIVTMLFDDKHRALHDFIAGTVVVRV